MSKGTPHPVFVTVMLTPDQMLDLISMCRVMAKHAQPSSKDRERFFNLATMLHERLIIHDMGPDVTIIPKRSSLQ